MNYVIENSEYLRKTIKHFWGSETPNLRNLVTSEVHRAIQEIFLGLFAQIKATMEELVYRKTCCSNKEY